MEDEPVMMGKFIASIHESSNALELLQKIEGLNLTDDEKDLLFIEAQIASGETESKMENVIKELEILSESGYIYPDMTFSEILKPKLEKLKKINADEMKELAINLMKKIQGQNIEL